MYASPTSETTPGGGTAQGPVRYGIITPPTGRMVCFFSSPVRGRVE